MSGWRNLYATVKNKNELPDKEDITEYISERGEFSQTFLSSLGLAEIWSVSMSLATTAVFWILTTVLGLIGLSKY